MAMAPALESGRDDHGFESTPLWRSTHVGRRAPQGTSANAASWLGAPARQPRHANASACLNRRKNVMSLPSASSPPYAATCLANARFAAAWTAASSGLSAAMVAATAGGGVFRAGCHRWPRAPSLCNIASWWACRTLESWMTCLNGGCSVITSSQRQQRSDRRSTRDASKRSTRKTSMKVSLVGAPSTSFTSGAVGMRASRSTVSPSGRCPKL
mmetsp:Transcript_6147/g.18308  ORF Transcript_6147/g.18308 Transcript_6147/m.18308 type:complete len:213 (-) Transcript_6147:692-1330(-)